MQIPPGPRHLLRHIHKILVPPAVAYAILDPIFKASLDVHLPRWLVILASFASLPTSLLLAEAYTTLTHARDAARRGAALPPQVKDKWPGGLGSLSALVKSMKVGYPADVFLQWTRQYGNTVSFSLMFERRIFTTDPEYIKAILSTNFDNFEKGPLVFESLHALLGTGVFNSDGERWKFHRAATRPYFHKERIRDVEIFDQHAEEAIKQTSQRLSEGFPVDFQEIVSRFTLDSATEFLFDNDVSSLSVGLRYPEGHRQTKDDPADTFSKAFLEAQVATAYRGRRGVHWPLFEFWTDAVKKPRGIVNEFIDPILETAIARTKAATEKFNGKEKSSDDNNSFLDHLVQLTDDKTILRDAILNVIVAGRDTTASTMTFAVYMLCEHPQVLQRLRQEILATVGSSRRPEFDDIKEMRYLRAFINETLRLYPAVPVNSRTSKQASVWPSNTPGCPPVYVPSGCRIMFSVFLMHRRTDLWGPDALVFDPDRFLDHRLKQYLTPNPFIFLPWNAGARICIGQQFAYHEMSFFLIRLLQRFSGFSLAPDAQPAWSKPPAEWAHTENGTKATDKIWPGAHLTSFIRGGLWVRLEEATSESESM